MVSSKQMKHHSSHHVNSFFAKKTHARSSHRLDRPRRPRIGGGNAQTVRPCSFPCSVALQTKGLGLLFLRRKVANLWLSIGERLDSNRARGPEARSRARGICLRRKRQPILLRSPSSGGEPARQPH